MAIFINFSKTSHLGASDEHSLFSTGGKMLKYVFGAATLGDVKKIQNMLLGTRMYRETWYMT